MGLDSRLNSIVDDEILWKLGEPSEVESRNEAYILKYDESNAVATRAFSLAGSMDRFGAGRITEPQTDVLSSLRRDFSEYGRDVVMVDEEIRDCVGESGLAIVEGMPTTFAVTLRSLDEVEEKIKEYSSIYAGEVEELYREASERGWATLPVLHNGREVIKDRDLLVMGGSGIMVGEPQPEIDDFLEREVESEPSNGLEVEKYPMPEDEELRFQVDIQVPGDYDTFKYELKEPSLRVQVDDRKEEVYLKGTRVKGYTENNGVISMEII